MRKKIASGITAICSVVASTVVAMIWPTIDPTMGFSILIACAVGLLIAGALWAWPERQKEVKGGGTTISQTTQGHQSPSIGSVGGNLTMNFGAENRPSGRGERAPYDIAAMNAGLGAAIRNATGASLRTCPKMPIWKAVRHVAAVIGDKNEPEHFPSARREIRQAAGEGNIEIWGRPTIPLVTLDQKLEPKEIWEPILSNYWSDFSLNDEATVEGAEDASHTVAEKHVSRGSLGGRFWALRVSEDQVERVWRKPEPPRDSPPRPDLGPNGWMAG